MNLPDSEVPGILIAMPGLKDPYFEKTVILLCNYNEEGAMGLVMNHPTDTMVQEILNENVAKDMAFDVPLLLGGPVQPETFWAVHSPDYEGDSTTHLSEGISLSSAQEVMQKLAEDNGPSIYHLGCGYSGWAPEQLDNEIQQESWWLAPLDEPLLMQLDYSQRWETSMKKLGFDPLTASFVKSGSV